MPEISTLGEGGNITLICNTSGIPSPFVRWTRIGRSRILSQSSSLTVLNVSRPGTPDNLIQYQCTASNGVDSPATATAYITVHCKYKATLPYDHLIIRTTSLLRNFFGPEQKLTQSFLILISAICSVPSVVLLMEFQCMHAGKVYLGLSA